MDTEYEELLRILADTQEELSAIDKRLEKITTLINTLTERRERILTRLELLNNRKAKILDR